MTTDRKKKIILVNPLAITISGVDESLYNLISTIDSESYEIVVVLPGEGYYTDQYRSLGVKVYIVDMDCLMRKNNPLFYLKYSWKLVCSLVLFMRIFIKEKADLVHINMFITFAPGIAAKLLDIPVIYHFRASTNLKPLWLFNMLYRMFCGISDKIITISKISASMLEKLTDKEIRVIYDSVVFKNGDGASLGKNNNNFVTLGILTRIHPDKNLEVIIDTVEILRSKNINSKFVISGSPVDKKGLAYEEELKERINQKSLGENVIFRGTVRDIYRELFTYDFYVFPVATEGFVPRSVIEALVAGVPVLAFQQPGVEEINISGTVNMVESLNPEDWANKITAMIAKKEQNLFDSGKEFYRNAFANEKCTMAIQSIYKELIK